MTGFNHYPDCTCGWCVNYGRMSGSERRRLELPTTGAPALAVLLETARRRAVRVWAEQSPFDLKDSLKRRSYRWSDGSDGRPRSWYVDLCETAVDARSRF